MNENQYHELQNIAIARFKENGTDILHDLILEHDSNYNKIKAFLLTQNYLNLEYETQTEKAQKEYMRLNSEKVCYHCKKLKTPNEFYIISQKHERYLSSYCKECIYIKKRKWLDNNKEREKQRWQRYYQANKEKLKLNRKIYVIKNRAYLNQRAKERYHQRKLKAESV